jgi:hypothetical protein
MHKNVREEFKMKVDRSFEMLMKKQGYSEKTIRKIWKWFDHSEKRGVASF